MNTKEYISYLNDLGIQLWIEENNICYKAPKGIITRTLLTELKERKQELIEYLKIQPPALKQVPGTRNLPLSFSQQRLWFLHHFEPNSSAYNIPANIRFKGPLNIPVLKKSVSEIIKRHESLRTTFKIEQGDTIQVIHPHLELELPEIDLTHLQGEEREKTCQELMKEHALRPFQLTRLPLLRITLLKLDANEFILLINIHHIVSDGWSQSVFTRELTYLYSAYIKNLEPELPALPIQYADFAVWQRNFLKGAVLEKQFDFWKKHFAPPLPILNLHLDMPRPAVQSFNGSEEIFTISSSMTIKLKNLCQECSTTLFILLFTAFNVFLCRYTGQEDIIVGTPIANRNKLELENLIGFFVNTLAIRTDLSGEPSFMELLNRIKQTVHKVYAHQDLPFEKLVEEIQPERNLNLNPLFQVMFVLQNTPTYQLRLEDLEISLAKMKNKVARFDFTLFIREMDNQLNGIVEYNTDLFEESTIKQMIEHFIVLLESIIENPAMKIDLLRIVPKKTLDQILIDWNRTESGKNIDRGLHQLFMQQAAMNGDSTAIIFDDCQITYGELDRKAGRIAYELRKLNVKKGDLAAIYMERSADMVAALLGIVKSGAAYVPMDTTYPPERLAYIMEDSHASVLITSTSLQDDMKIAFHRERGIPFLLVDKNTETYEGKGEGDDVRFCADDLAYVIHTSGSSGKPKGVMITHCSVVNVLYSFQSRLNFTTRSRFLAVTTICFDISVLELFLPLITGGVLVVATRDEAMDGQHLARLIDRHRITHLQATPSTFRILLDSGWSPPADLTILCGGESLSPDLARKLTGNGSPVWNVYGPTETTIWSTAARIDPNNPVITIGRPIDNTQCYITDRNMQPVPRGAVGELYIGGDGVGKGYLNKPDLTAQKFIADPFSRRQGSRLYRTGDLACYRRDGEIIFLGRGDHQVKIRGFRIELGEIETSIRTYPAVKDAVVTLQEINNEKYLIAYLIPDFRIDAGNSSSVVRQLHEEQVSRWKEVWEEYYSLPVSGTDYILNLAGWNSSYTGQPIPTGEMTEWVEETVKRILSSKPQKILEIGCGTGMLLYRLAPHCCSYTGLDFSEQVLDGISRNIAQHKDIYDNVRLFRKEADHVSEIPDNDFDTVIINSVAQYFPGIDYFIHVIESIIPKLSRGGIIFLGDIRSLPLACAFYTSLEYNQADSGMGIDEFKQRIQKRAANERELLIDPLLFFALKQRIPEISHVEIRHKHAANYNELSCFRYDVFIYIGKDLHFPELKQDVLNWQKSDVSLSWIARLIGEKQPEILRITDIPNKRVYSDNRLNLLLEKDIEFSAVGALKEHINGKSPVHPVDPQEFLLFFKDFPYGIELFWNNSINEDCFSVCMIRQDKGSQCLRGLFPPYFEYKKSINSWYDFANNPLQSRFSALIGPQLVSFLKQTLPDYMIPHDFIALEEFPMTPNGKIDRKLLPVSEHISRKTRKKTIPPRTSAERMIAEIWKDILALEEISIDDNFFEIGGHSLVAAPMIFRLKDIFQIELFMRDIFENPVLEKIALRIQQLKENREKDRIFCLVKLQTAFGRPNFFCVHPVGGSVERYLELSQAMGKQQPFYAFQHPGIEGDSASCRDVESMAATYIKAMKTVQTHGPYYIGGWSFGGCVAFEMAHKLLKEKEEVALLALMDTPSPEIIPRKDNSKMLLALAIALEQTYERRIPVSYEELCRLSGNKQIDYFLDSIGKALTEENRKSGSSGDSASDFKNESSKLQVKQINRIMNVYKICNQAMEEYKPEIYPGKVVMFRSRELEDVKALEEAFSIKFDHFVNVLEIDETVDPLKNPGFGWSKYCAEPIDVQYIPGTHRKMFEQPHVRVFADKLNQYLADKK